MNNREELKINREEYRLTLEHRYIRDDGKYLHMEEPKTYSYSIASDDRGDVIAYRTHVIRELFLRFMESVLHEVE